MDPSRLKQIDLFSPMPDEALQRYADMADEISLKEGEELARAGTWPYQLFAIEEGTVEVQRDGDTLAKLGAGDVVGETGVVKRGLRNADVVATSPVKAIYFTQDQMKQMRKDLPDLDDRLHQILEERS
ncbi:MAG TPA: cyclic nucleotide-binding domain-containing protein [Thermoleophilaceae bacterium]|nr:cyclic nucleotide-binding domain-containing protein [Thermoleophilaceae bacterium]